MSAEDTTMDVPTVHNLVLGITFGVVAAICGIVALVMWLSDTDYDPVPFMSFVLFVTFTGFSLYNLLWYYSGR